MLLPPHCPPEGLPPLPPRTLPLSPHHCWVSLSSSCCQNYLHPKVILDRNVVHLTFSTNFTFIILLLVFFFLPFLLSFFLAPIIHMILACVLIDYKPGRSPNNWYLDALPCHKMCSLVCLMSASLIFLYLLTDQPTFQCFLLDTPSWTQSRLFFSLHKSPLFEKSTE